MTSDKPEEMPAQTTMLDEKTLALASIAARAQAPHTDLPTPTSPGFHHSDHVKDASSRGMEESMGEIQSNTKHSHSPSPTLSAQSRVDVEPSDLSSSFQIVGK